ncbi:MAG TPA: hypothetical protein VIC07_13110 [Acidimicrobiia bacterium]|jgi:hypothetical protein
MNAKADAFAEEAILAVGRGDVAGARIAVAQAYDIDHALAALVDAVHLACAEIEEDGTVSTSTWNTLADAVAPGHLLVVVESSRQ